jgi:hypothetical protein
MNCVVVLLSDVDAAKVVLQGTIEEVSFAA